MWPNVGLRRRCRTDGAGRETDEQDEAEEPDAQYPYILTTGRVLYHWHGGELTRRAKGLLEIYPETLVEINPEDAREMDVQEGDTLRITSRRGSILIGARLSERQARGQVFIPMHFREAAANLLTNPQLDPYARIASFKVSAVRVEPVREAEEREAEEQLPSLV